MVTILAIESSCDDTSAAVLREEYLLSNVMASQEVHKKYGGVVPELASRAHQQNILPVVSQALDQAGVTVKELDAIAFTRGPGLLGSLLVGTAFAKGLAIATGKPLVEVNHLQGHILSHFIRIEGREHREPKFPYLSLLVSGGHTQIVKVNDYLDFEILGHTIDDAVGEAFDKCAKLLGLGYPGGPIIDRLAKEGNASAFRFAKPNIAGLDYSFSGIKTSLLYFLRDNIAENPDFLEENKKDICASYQKDLIDILLKKLILASKQTGIKEIALGGGVSANSYLRERVTFEGEKRGWNVFLPELRFTTDNAAMIGIAGLYRYREGLFAPIDVAPISRAADYNQL
ncbi:MAG: tRNA (adenosine(37)-N6)-threonylcarbamoyltransferase complex transferase subunit TsaD [Bacteroidales bacterium]|jgi:N6-L-threonylcarbamoyladenine synthase|nr:tRNA (adenosine(37)-N6)-threonylcarbamoyltransferase complex transferase subunit TsaD [Bacteroidales bacterium]HPH54075.1 tRNA (adenosine(37)-N6)-threonylcarbamoyltransferase complex transferase subunit TsaD [Bacteroidales bacterium]